MNRELFKDMNINAPLNALFPKSWRERFNSGFANLEFRNLEHFKSVVSQMTQRDDNNCDVSYAKALDMLIKGQTDFPEEERVLIRQQVRDNLHKRGLITQEVYEAFQYSDDGTQVDVDIGKYAAGESDCIISPAREYVDYFYELFISISYPWSVSNDTIRKNVAKLLATIEELERQHIFIKITLVFPDTSCSGEEGYQHFFSSIPLFSHKDHKSVETMSSVLNDRLLRKFYFAILENFYGDKLYSGYGTPTVLNTAMNPGTNFDEVELFQTIFGEVGAMR